MSPFYYICRIKLGTVLRCSRYEFLGTLKRTHIFPTVFACACAAVHSMANIRLNLMNITFIFCSISEIQIRCCLFATCLKHRFLMTDLTRAWYCILLAWFYADVTYIQNCFIIWHMVCFYGQETKCVDSMFSDCVWQGVLILWTWMSCVVKIRCYGIGFVIVLFKDCISFWLLWGDPQMVKLAIPWSSLRKLLFKLQEMKKNVITFSGAWSLIRLNVKGMFQLNFEFGMPAWNLLFWLING